MKTTSTIKAILKNNEKTRNSDKELILAYWEAHGLYLTPAQEAVFLRMPSTETIRRVRQKIQEQGLYPATEKIRRTRKAKGMVIQQNIPKAKVDHMDKLFDDTQYTNFWDH